MPPEFRAHWGDYNNGYMLSKDDNIVDILEQRHPDILILTTYNSKNAIKASNWARKRKKVFFLGPHEILRSDNVHPLKFYLKQQRYKWLTRGSSGIMTMGKQAVKEFSDIFSNKRITSIPYSFDLSSLLNYKSNTLSNELVFLMSGRLYKFRNPILGIQAFAKLLNNNPQKKLKLIISGTGPLYDECTTLINQLKIGQQVQWLNPKFKDWYDIHNIYKHADVLLALQNYGTWGLIIQEAMAAGLGIVASKYIQSADSLIINGYNGFLNNLHMTTILNQMQAYVDNDKLVTIHAQRSRDIVKTVDVTISAQKFVDFISPNL